MLRRCCGVRAAKSQNPKRWGRTSAAEGQAVLLRNRWACQPMWELCLDLFYSCRETSWPGFSSRGNPPGGFVYSLWSLRQQLHKCRSILGSGDTPCDLGQPRVLALLLGNGSHLHYTTQRELSDRVVFLMNVRGDVQLWG